MSFRHCERGILNSLCNNVCIADYQRLTEDETQNENLEQVTGDVSTESSTVSSSVSKIPGLDLLKIG